MAAITLTNVKKDFGDITILQNISFEVQEGEKVGLIGDNGTGKTTLLKLITGYYECTEGSIFMPEKIKLGVLDQIPVYPDSYTVEMVLREAFSELEAMSTRMRQLENRMASGDSEAINEYGKLSTAFELAGGYNTDVELARIANGLKISKEMLSSPFNRLSGGERTRINLGRIILMSVDLMLLDEPTNHLDIESVEWLEKFLADYKGAAIIISHDRYFLDQTVTRIVELENLSCKVWEGNYSKFLFLKDEWLRAAELKYNQDERKIKQLEFTVMRFHGMGTEKLHKRAFSMEKRIEKMRKEQPQIYRKGQNLKATFKSAARSGNDVLTVTGLQKRYGDRVLFSDVELEVKKDDKIALIGSNGTGKTTLLKILLGEEQADSGRVRWGAGVKFAYLPQLVTFKSDRISALDCVTEELSLSPASARSILGKFHFSGIDAYKLVGELSGGEKSRLRLCIMMHAEVNMLILDEPTNHLDIRSREWMEEAIENYEGTLLLVSHDRYFISRFADKIWSLENGRITDFEGEYDDFRAFSALVREREEEEREQIKQQSKKEKTGGNKRSRESDSIKRQITILESEIQRCETELAGLEALVEENASDHVRLAELYEDITAAKAVLDKKMQLWTDLMERLDD